MSLISNTSKTRQTIRNKIRFIRNHLTPQEQFQASQKIVNYIKHDDRIKQAQNIGVFIHFDGEIKTNHLIETLLNLKKKIYLPILNPFKQSKTLLFSQYIPPLTTLTFNKFKIHEPKFKKSSILITIVQLDILFIPLVAFDVYGNRLGMGGGFYDYTLKNWKNNNNKKFLIGLAHNCQQTQESIPKETWDIPMTEIITPSKHWIWKNEKPI